MSTASHKYAVLQAVSAGEGSAGEQAPTAVEKPSAPAVPQATRGGGGPPIIPSKEHTTPITALTTYTTDMDGDSLVRIYDGVIAQRDEPFLVARKDLVGRSPEALQAHFSLAFVPRLMCDAYVPAGNRITYGRLTNAAGKKVAVYRAETALNLAAERPLTPENIPPRPRSSQSQPRPEAPPSQRSEQPVAKFVAPDGFDAEDYLRQLPSGSGPGVPVPDRFRMVGRDGFPYLAASLDREPLPQGGTGDGHGDQLVDNLVQTLLNDGLGLVVWRQGEKDKPLWVYKYGDLLCFKLFGALRPPAEFDETLYPDTLDKPLPAGTRIITTHPSDQIFPSYARKVLNLRVATVLGRPVNLDPRFVEYPEIDALKRLRLKLVVQGLSDETRKAVGREAFWCLPYVVYF